jgi:hypothetical protein
LEEARGDEHPWFRREPADQGRRGEHDEASGEEPASAPEVTDPAQQQKQAAEGQGVAVQDPLGIRPGEVKLALDRWQRHAHDRGVDHCNE